MSANGFLDRAAPIAIAHRGGNQAHPENTLAAFEDALALGYRHLETDVHATRDGVVVAFHDERLDRVSDASGFIRERSWDDLRRIRITGGHRIPRLQEILERWPDVCVNIDPKTDRVVEPLSRLLGRYDVFHRICIGSFSGARLRRLRHRFGPRLVTSAGPREVAAVRLSSLGLPTRWLGGVGANCLQVPLQYAGIRLIDPSFLGHARRLGLPVHVWTVNDRSTMHRLLDLGVDGLMTDDIRLLKAVFESRGLALAGQHRVGPNRAAPAPAGAGGLDAAIDTGRGDGEA